MLDLKSPVLSSNGLNSIQAYSGGALLAQAQTGSETTSWWDSVNSQLQKIDLGTSIQKVVDATAGRVSEFVAGKNNNTKQDIPAVQANPVSGLGERVSMTVAGIPLWVIVTALGAGIFLIWKKK